MMACTEMLTMCLLSAKHAYSPKATELSPHFGQGLAIFHDVSLGNGEPWQRLGGHSPSSRIRRFPERLLLEGLVGITPALGGGRGGGEICF